MSAPSLAAVLVALAALLLALAFGHAAPRLAPRWLQAARGPIWPLAAGLLSAALTLPRLVSVDPLAALSTRAGVARFGAEGAAAALALALASLLALVLLLALGLRRRHDHAAAPLHRRARPPAGASALLLGVAPDGSALEALRRPLRWGLAALALALIAALPLAPRALDPLVWALAALWLVAGINALAPSAAPVAAEASAAAAPASAPLSDAQARLHAALGHPPLVESEPALLVPATLGDELARAFSAPAPRLVAVAAPPGAGKRRAAEALAASYAARGLTTLWLGPGDGTLAAALAEGTRFTRLGLVVVDASATLLGEDLAALRYGLHRIAARERCRPDVLVLGTSPSVVASARAIAAAEPRLVSPALLPTRPIQRFLLARAPAPRLAAELPPATLLVPLDRPRPLARHPDAPAREYLIPFGGPRGRRMQEDRAAGLTQGRASRLLVTLPGDRKSGERPGELARFHLRAALAEMPQDLERLREVFSPRLVDDELAALARTGLISHASGWTPRGAESSGNAAPSGLVAVARVAARLPLSAQAAPATVALVEPRSGRRCEVSKARADLDHYDGAIVTLFQPPERFEVRVAGDGSRALVPSELASATPLRTLTFELAEAPARSRLRFRGARELEVWEGAVDLMVQERGVRQFSDGPAGAEARAFTRLASEPARLAPLRTHARLVLLDAAGAPTPGGAAPASPSRAALHAMAHALREVLPCFFDNAADVGVSYCTPSEALGRAALVLYDAHPAGLGAVADMRDDELEALLLAAAELLACDCAAHCAACCESTSCSEVEVPLSRHEALALLREIALPQPIPLAPRAHAALLRRTG